MIGSDESQKGERDVLYSTRQSQERISTGSSVFDSLFCEGLPIASVTDVYGAAATGKTQFAFQNAVMTCASKKAAENKPLVIFIDCAGSFRPERIAEIAESRGFSSSRVLESISSVNVRSVSDQIVANSRILEQEMFSKCKLIIVDDVTMNFASEMNDSEQIIERQSLLSSYMRKLAYIANARDLSVLLTNSIRSRGDSSIGETTGDIISEYALFRVYFKKIDATRIASIEQPLLAKKAVRFEIETRGIP
ncbi:MAG: P-loop NTPase family protein [Nitrososphaerales archaeon]